MEFELYLLGPFPFLQIGSQMVCPPFTALLSIAIDEEIADKTPIAASVLFNELLEAIILFVSPYPYSYMKKERL